MEGNAPSGLARSCCVCRTRHFHTLTIYPEIQLPWAWQPQKRGPECLSHFRKPWPWNRGNNCGIIQRQFLIIHISFSSLSDILTHASPLPEVNLLKLFKEINIWTSCYDFKMATHFPCQIEFEVDSPGLWRLWRIKIVLIKTCNFCSWRQRLSWVCGER